MKIGVRGVEALGKHGSKKIEGKLVIESQHIYHAQDLGLGLN